MSPAPDHFLTPENHFNYFHAPAWNSWGMDPSQWVAFVLVIGMLCLATTIVLIRTRSGWFSRSRLLLFCLVPCLAGSVGSFVQNRLLVHAGRGGWSTAFPLDQLEFCHSYSTHIGVYCSVAMVALVVPFHSLRARSQRGPIV
jgi:hypothetical protein